MSEIYAPSSEYTTNLHMMYTCFQYRGQSVLEEALDIKQLVYKMTPWKHNKCEVIRGESYQYVKIGVIVHYCL